MDLYFLAYKLHIDIDTIKSWDYIKVYKWMIALKKINDKTREQVEKIQSEQELKRSLASNEEVIVRNAAYCK